MSLLADAVNAAALTVAIFAAGIALAALALSLWERFSASPDIWVISTWMNMKGELALDVVLVNTGHRQGVVTRVGFYSPRVADVPFSQPEIVAELPIVLPADSASKPLRLRLIPGGPPKLLEALRGGEVPELEVEIAYVARPRSELGQTKVETGEKTQRFRLPGEPTGWGDREGSAEI